LTATFPLIPRRRVLGLPFGGLHSIRRGLGSDVASSRPYQPGDDVGRIDWNASARLSLARGTEEFVVREHYAEEAPRVVVLVDRRPSMSVFPEGWPWLCKPRALDETSMLIGASSSAARGLLGALEEADGDMRWRPPRSEHTLFRRDDDPVFTAPEDTVERGLDFLYEQRRDLPAGSFVFVLSDFLAPVERGTWLRALERRWEVVPVVIQDPTWEQSFPDVGGVVVPYVDPQRGGVTLARVSTSEAADRREQNEHRHAELVRTMRAMGMDPVVVSSHDHREVVLSFLTWADQRLFTRGRA
jgi:uncharacterized protein (DUF58 family)